jgi:hypothetical protein
MTLSLPLCMALIGLATRVLLHTLECNGMSIVRNVQIETTFNNGSLGSRIDEERSEMR